jgi:hypothetical protein
VGVVIGWSEAEQVRRVVQVDETPPQPRANRNVVCIFAFVWVLIGHRNPLIWQCG